MIAESSGAVPVVLEWKKNGTRNANLLPRGLGVEDVEQVSGGRTVDDT